MAGPGSAAGASALTSRWRRRRLGRPASQAARKTLWSAVQDGRDPAKQAVSRCEAAKTSARVVHAIASIVPHHDRHAPGTGGGRVGRGSTSCRLVPLGADDDNFFDWFGAAGAQPRNLDSGDQ